MDIPDVEIIVIVLFRLVPNIPQGGILTLISSTRCTSNKLAHYLLYLENFQKLVA